MENSFFARSFIWSRKLSISPGIKYAAQVMKRAAINRAMTVIIKIENPSEVLVAIKPARAGAIAAPLFSMKY